MRALPTGRAGASGHPRMSRLLLASLLIMVTSVAWFVANIDHPIGPHLLLWLSSPVATVVVTLVHWRTSRTMSLPAETRRFWRHQSIATTLVGVATAAQAYDVLQNPEAGGLRASPAMLTFDTLAIVVIVWSLYRLPLGAQTGGERLRVALDAGTVMLATAVFMWYFQTRPLLAAGGDRSTTLVTASMVTALAMVAVFAVAKVMLSSYAFVDRGALLLLAFAMLFGSLGSLPQRFLVDTPYLVFAQVSVPMVMFFAAWAGERQWLAAGKVIAPSMAEVGRRPFSVLPYLAVAAVDALLVAVLWHPDGGELVIGIVAVLLTGVVVLRQITAFQDNRRLLDRLDHGATHDALTQLPNRQLFAERLHAALTAPGGRTLSVALIDLDDFKAVNDNLGHETGDALLVAVAQRLAGCVRPTDTVARLGGDEFVVILDGVQDDEAAASAERIIAALAAPVVAEGHELLIRASIGIANGRDGLDASDLLRQADIAMYAAKGRGGSRYLTYEAGMAGAVANHAQLGAELRQAIIDERLYLLYQPIVDLDDDARLIGVEALVRWAHPVRGALPPSDFIPLAERNGLIVPMGRWVLRQACRQFVAWSAEHGAAAPAVLNVNVSARELREPGFAADVAAVLAETSMASRQLVLEVTETTIFELGASVTNLGSLRALGVRISLDDFGTGQSTLSVLQNCEVDELKLDRSFTQAEVTGEPTVAAAVLQLARTFGLHVVAEGVETTEQAAWLRRIGYQAAQGYHFARPTTAAEIGRILTTGARLFDARAIDAVGATASPAA